MDSNLILSWLGVHVWQVSLLFVAVWIATRFIGKKLPHLTLLLWTVFFIKCMTPPIIESPIGVMGWLTPGNSVSAEDMLGVDGANMATTSLNPPPIHAVSFESNEMLRSVSGAQFAWMLILLWVVGAVILTCLTLWRYFHVVTTIRKEGASAEGCSVIDEWESQLARQLRHLGWNKGSVNLVFSSTYRQPFVFGVLQPTIVIPRHYLGDTIDREFVLGHELCHLWRRDSLLGWLQMLSQVLLWFHPAVWLASRTTNFWCEVCCDDDTMRIFSIPTTSYARGLLNALESQGSPTLAASFPSLSPSMITRGRIEMILSRSHSGLVRATYVLSACLLGLLFTPSTQSEDMRIGIDVRLLGTEVAQPDDQAGRSRLDESIPEDMNFLIGSWSVHDASGSGSKVGQSEFTVEESGKMIREAWIDRLGGTAQGISFFDPSDNQWRMTWVDSTGSISETKGTWNQGTLLLTGKMTGAGGKQVDVVTKLTRLDDRTFRSTLSVGSDDQKRELSTVEYRRQ